MRGSWWTIASMALLLCCQVGKSRADDKFWRSYIEMETRAGDVWAGQGNLFVPLHQSEVSMLFADVRGNWTDVQSAHGNFGVGFRQMLVNDWIFGIHSALDIRHSEFGNSFQQGVLGLEMMNVDWGVRWNGYLANDDPEIVASRNAVTLDNGQLWLQQAAERAYSGQDFEVERRLWFREAPSDNSWHDWGTFHDMEFWAALGVYNFDADTPGFDQITGPRARFELRIYDVPFAGHDSRLVVGGQLEDDDVRGTVSQASLTLRIPFGRGTSRPRSRLRCLNRRMVAPIERNTDIISVLGLQGREQVAFANGQAINNVVSIDANTAGLPGTIPNDDSLVLVDGSQGTIGTGTINLADSQTLLGGGSSIIVRGVNSGASAVFTAPGSRPLIDSGANTTIAAATNSRILGLDIQNTGNSISGIDLNGVTGVQISDVNIQTQGDTAFGILANNARGSFSGGNINTSGPNSSGVFASNFSNLAVNNLEIGTSGNNSPGVEVIDDSFVTVANTQIFTSGGANSEGIRASDRAQLSVQSSTVTVAGPNTQGIVAAPSAAGDTLSVLVANSVVNATSNGIVVGSTVANSGDYNATIIGNTVASTVGSDEILVQTAGGTANASVSGNTVPSLTGTIRLANITGGMFVTQSAPGSGPTSIDAANRIPRTNVLTTGDPIIFDSPAPTLPMANP